MTNNLLEDVAKTTLVEVGKDLAQPGAKQLGRAGASVGRWVAAFCGKLDKYSAKMEAENKAAIDAIEKHYNNIPEEFRVHPNPRITHNAEQAFFLSTGQPDLQKLFVNLIKSSCDSRTARGVLPSFVSIIEQLTPDEAKMLRQLLTSDYLYQFPVITIRSDYQDSSKGGLDVTELITPLYWKSGCEFPQNGPVYLDNLQRLQLIDVDMMKHFTNLELYKEIEEMPEVKKIVSDINTTPQRKARFVRGIIRLTNYGKALCEACKIRDIA